MTYDEVMKLAISSICDLTDEYEILEAELETTLEMLDNPNLTQKIAVFLIERKNQLESLISDMKTSITNEAVAFKHLVKLNASDSSKIENEVKSEPQQYIQNVELDTEDNTLKNTLMITHQFGL